MRAVWKLEHHDRGQPADGADLVDRLDGPEASLLVGRRSSSACRARSGRLPARSCSSRSSTWTASSRARRTRRTACGGPSCTPYVAGTPQPEPGRHGRGSGPRPRQGRLHGQGEEPEAQGRQISGKVLVGGAGAAASVQFFKPSNVNKPLKTVRTSRSGAYSWRKKFTKKTRLLVVAVGVTDLGTCPATPLPGMPRRLRERDALVRRRDSGHGQAAQQALTHRQDGASLEGPRPLVSWRRWPRRSASAPARGPTRRCTKYWYPKGVARGRAPRLLRGALRHRRGRLDVLPAARRGDGRSAGPSARPTGSSCTSRRSA